MYLNFLFFFTFWFSTFKSNLCSELYSDRVLNYDSKNFQQNVGGTIPHFVNFYAPWCGYCKRLKPVWDELAEKYNIGSGQRLIIAKVDCTVETPTCADELVSGYPTLVFYAAGKKEGTKYQAKRDLLSLEDFISTNLEGKTMETASHVSPSASEESGALKLTDDNFDTTVEFGLHFVKFYAPWCGHCQRMASAWEQLADSFNPEKSVTISKVDCTEHKKICADFEVKGYPTLLWIVNGKKIEKYQGGRTLDELKQFVTDMKGTHLDSVGGKEDSAPEVKEENPDLVVQLSKDNFENAVAQGVTFVNFFVPWCGHCKKLAPIWRELAIKFASNPKVKIAKVDCTQEEELCGKYEIVGYPSLYIYRDGQFATEYHAERKLEVLHSFILSNLQQDTVKHTEL